MDSEAPCVYCHRPRVPVVKGQLVDHTEPDEAYDTATGMPVEICPASGLEPKAVAL